MDEELPLPSVSRRSGRKRSITQKALENTTPHTCVDCSQWFKSAHELSRHLKSVHTRKSTKSNNSNTDELRTNIQSNTIDEIDDIDKTTSVSTKQSKTKKIKIESGTCSTKSVINSEASEINSDTLVDQSQKWNKKSVDCIMTADKISPHKYTMKTQSQNIDIKNENESLTHEIVEICEDEIEGSDIKSMDPNNRISNTDISVTSDISNNTSERETSQEYGDESELIPIQNISLDDIVFNDISKDFYVIPKTNEKALILEALFNGSERYLVIRKSDAVDVFESFKDFNVSVSDVKMVQDADCEIAEVHNHAPVFYSGDNLNDEICAKKMDDQIGASKLENEIGDNKLDDEIKSSGMKQLCENSESKTCKSDSEQDFDRSNHENDNRYDSVYHDSIEAIDVTEGDKDIKFEEGICSKCNKQFTDIESYKQHIKRNCKAVSFECNVCGKTFKCQSFYVNHMDGHNKTSFKCIACSEIFDTQKKLNSHIKDHKGMTVICAICYSRVQLTSMNGHFERVHPGFDVQLATEEELAKSISETHRLLENKSLYDRDGDMVMQPDKATPDFISSNMIFNSTHNSLQLNVCKTCGADFATEKELCVHHLIHFSDRPFFCTTCHRQFTTAAYLEFHKTLHGAAYIHGCPVCGKRFREFKQLQGHMKKHKQEKEHVCEFCDKNFATIGERKQHEVIHANVKPFVCNYCGNSFKRKVTLRVHEKSECTKKADFVMKLTSEDKNVSFEETNEIIVEMDMTINPDSKSDEDILRNVYLNERVTFDDASNIKNEDDRNIDTDEKMINILNNNEGRTNLGEYACVVSSCEEHFLTIAELMDHVKTHNVMISSKKKKIVHLICQTCGKSFPNKNRLRIHMNIHTKAKKYQCNVCSRVFYDRGNMAKHRNTHIEQRAFVCQICGKSFKTKIALHSHFHVHRTDEPYKCDECPKTFKTRGNFIIHKKRHAKYKPNQCQYCDYSCLEANKMRRHELRHTSNDIIQCDICHKVFKDTIYLKQHMKLHDQPQYTYICDICSMKFKEEAALLRHSKLHETEVYTSEFAV